MYSDGPGHMVNLADRSIDQYTKSTSLGRYRRSMAFGLGMWHWVMLALPSVLKIFS